MKNNYRQPKKQIKNLEDLRLAKKNIRRELKSFERKQENSAISKAFNMVTSFRYDQDFASSKIEESLNWLGEKASNKFPMNGITKILVSGLIVIAVPIITSKVQDYFKKKF